MSMKKKGEPAMKPMSLHQSLGHGKAHKGSHSEDPKGLFASLKEGGKSKGKGMSMNTKDDSKTTVHIPSAGAMKKKVEKQMSGQKKAKMPK